MHASIAGPIFELAVGEVTEPIRLSFSGKPHFALFQVADEMPVPMAASERKVREEIFARKRAERYQFLLDSLLTVYNPQLQVEQISWLNEYSQSKDVETLIAPEEWANLPICSYRDGQINISDFLQIGRQLRVSKAELSDAERVEYILREVVIPAHLFSNEANLLGLDKDDSLVSRVKNKRDDLLLNTLRERYVDANA